LDQRPASGAARQRRTQQAVVLQLLSLLSLEHDNHVSRFPISLVCVEGGNEFPTGVAERVHHPLELSLIELAAKETVGAQFDCLIFPFHPIFSPLQNSVIEPTSRGGYLANKDVVRVEDSMGTVKLLTICYCPNIRDDKLF
jgi:hypothetical protein